MKTTTSIALLAAILLCSMTLSAIARADEKPRRACEMLFIARSVPEKRVMTNADGQPIDERGNVLDASGKPKSEVGAPRLQLVSAQGHKIYDVEALQKLLEEDTSLTESMKSEYKKMIAKGDTRLLVQVSNLSMLDPLYELMPNFKTTLDRIKRAMMVSIMSGEPIVLPPIILLGEPGVGKTFFAELLAEAIGTGYGFIPMNSTTAGWILAGSAATWSTASMGKVARILIEGKYANPVIVVDEIDKAGSTGKQYDPLAAFYQLWESHTAKNFTDEFLRVAIDASLINWIATANYADQIPDPIRKRAIVVEVPSPNESQLRVIVNNVLAIYLKKHPGLKFSGVVSDDVFAIFKKNTPRDIRMLIQDAVGGALIAGRTELKPEDIDMAVVQEKESVKRGIGFIQ
jgi:ATP-dependent Lon protease